MNVDLIREYADQGLTRKEIAQCLKMPLSTVSNNCTKYGIKTKRPDTTGIRSLCENTKMILDLREQGFGYRVIAQKVGVDRTQVLRVCNKYGLGGQRAEVPILTEEQVKNIVDQSGFDYVGGFESSKKPITVRCRKCGRTFERQYHIFRDVVNGTWQWENECPLCKNDRTQKEKQEREEKRKQEIEYLAKLNAEKAEHDARIKAEQQAKEEAELISRQMESRLAIHVCKNCGQEYSIGVTGYNSEQYCSLKCMKRWVMRVKNDRRLRRLKSRPMDTDITLEKLFTRDHGICYLCGKPCDWADVTDGNAGDQYPSIDHVKPVSKGGSHTWGNIKLAHRGCNIVKRDSDTPR